MSSAGVAAQAQKVAAAQSQIRVLYDSANGNGGPGFFKTEHGAPLYTFAKGSLAPPAVMQASGAVAAGKWGVATPYTYSVNYHLVWIPDSSGGKAEGAGAAEWPRLKSSAKDELPFFPVPEKYADGESHAKYVEDDCDDGTKEEGDPECEKKWKWTDHYPHRELVTQTFPYGHYVPQDTYPYIRGPYHHHLENGNGKQFVDHGGHWVWVSDDNSKIQDHFAPPEDKYQPPPYGQRG